MADPSVITILFFAANPAVSSQSRLEQEARDISDGLLRAKNRHLLKFEQRWAVHPRDIQLALLEYSPQIVHFAGYRTPENQEMISQEPGKTTELGFEQEMGLAFQDDTGHISPIDANALANLFKLFSDRVNCVLLNGCYTESQAKIIAQHISYVIGMKHSITDKAAIDFALGFYDALGAGRTIKFAYHLGCTAIHMAGLPEHLTPILYEKVELNAISNSKQNNSSILESNFFNSTNQKISSKQHLQEKREDLEEEYQEIRKKLKYLKKEWIIKSDTEAKYELSQRIEEYEFQLQNIEDLLEQLNKK